MTLYRENLEPLEERFDKTTREVVVRKFFDKVGDTETLPSVYFQSRLGDIGRSIKETFELATAAYDKVQKLSLRDDERPIKISVMSTLADVFDELRRYTDEIPLREEIVAECKRCFPEKRDDITIAAKKFLADALKRGDRGNDALEIRRQIFELFDERDGEKFICVAKGLAEALKINCDYEAVLTIRRRILACAENAHDDEAVVAALINLIFTLEHFSDKEHLEERVVYYRRFFEFHENVELLLVVSYELEGFVKTLKQLGRDEEAEQACKKFVDDLKRRIEAVEEPNTETVKVMNVLALVLDETSQEMEAEHWRGKIRKTVTAVIEKICGEPIEDYNAAIYALVELSITFSVKIKDLKIEVVRAILALTEKKPAVKESEIIEAKQNLLRWLYLDYEDNRAEAEQLFEDVENYYRQKLPTSREDFLNTLREHADFLQDHSAAVKKFTESLDLLEKYSEPFVDERLEIMRNIASVFAKAENYSEELIWRERILNFCREHFAEGAPEILDTFEGLISVCKKLNDYDKAELYDRELVDLTERNCGAAHVKTIEAKQKLADILHDADKYVDELNLREQIVDLWRENFSVSPANKVNYFSEFIDAGINFARLILESADEFDATAERLKALDRLKSLLEETIDGYGEGSDEATKILDCLDDIRYLIGDDAQALAKFDELFRAYFSQDDEDTDDEENSASEDDSPDETSLTEIDASESLNLIKGQRVPLAKDDSVPEKLTVDFRWESDAAL